MMLLNDYGDRPHICILIQHPVDQFVKCNWRFYCKATLWLIASLLSINMRMLCICSQYDSNDMHLDIED